MVKMIAHRLILSLATLASALLTTPADAASLLVDIPDDNNPFTIGNITTPGVSGDLRYVLNFINQNANTYTVTFNLPGDPIINLGGILPLLNLTASNTLTIDGTNGGNQIEINGGGAFPGFFARQGNITIENLIINNTIAQGGNGALGAGGGLFIDAATVTVSNLIFSANQAIGGNGLAGQSAGGGMFQGFGTSIDLGSGKTGGAGGLGTNGILGGGGIGPNGNGGAFGSVGPGGGFGAGPGGAADATHPGGVNAGGGGGGVIVPLPSTSGGGGANGGDAVSALVAGNGGYGGGGGASAGNGGSGGNGGFGGGGGYNGFLTGSGGSGGFGGAGGSDGSGPPNGTAGKGGFGAAGGSSLVASGTSGVGGGFSSAGSGGGGAGLGAAIFVNSGQNPAYFNATATSPISGGGSLIVNGNLTILGGTAIGGSGGGGAGAGAGTATAIFATSSTDTLAVPYPITFNPGIGQTATISGSALTITIADDSSASLPGGTFQGGSASGAAILMQGAGTLFLDGFTSFHGGLVMTNGTTRFTETLGDQTNFIQFQGDATLQVGAAVTLSIGNSFAIANGVTGTFDTNIGSIVTFGTVSGAGSLYKIGSLVLGLAASNTYSGGTTISGGTLTLLSGGSLLATGPVTINSPGAFDISTINPLSTTIGDLIGDGTVTLGSKTLVAGTSNSTTFSGVIQGTNGSFTKQGTGTLILSGLNTYTGLTTVSDGTLQLTTANIVTDIVNNSVVNFNQSTTGTFSHNITGTGSLLVNGGGTVNLTGTNTYNGGTTVQANTVLYGPTTAIQGNINNSGTVDFEGTSTYNDVISGTGSTSINDFGGSGTITFTKAQLYTGKTTIANGTLALSGSGGLQAATSVQIGSTGTFDISGMTATGMTIADLMGSGTVILGAKFLTFGTATPSTTYAGVIQGSGGIVKQGTGLVILSGVNTYTGTTTVTAGELVFAQTGVTSLTSNMIISSGATVDFDQATSGVGTYSGIISGAGNVNINEQGGTGTVILTGANTYTGGTTAFNGTLQGTPTSLQGNIKINTNALVDIEQSVGTGQFIGHLQDNGVDQHGNVAINKAGGTGTVVFTTPSTYTGTTTVYNGTLQGTTVTLPESIVIQNGALVDFEQSFGTGTYTGSLSGAGGVVINSSGADNGKVIFSGSNTYTGGTLISNGTLQGNTTSLVGTITDNAALFFNQLQDGIFAGSVQGNGTLTITGTGKVTFNNNSSAFTGTTNITQGALALNTILGGSLFVQNGGHLSGNGTILGNVTVETGGIIRPGNSIGTITIGGNYEQESGALYQVQVNGVNSSLITVAGTATLHNGSVLEVIPHNDPINFNHTYTILTATGGLSGTFTNVFTANPSVTPTVTYDSNNAFLNLNVNFDLLATTFNQQQVAQQLTSPSALAIPEINAILNELINLPVEEAKRALSQMSAEQYTNVILTAELANHQFLRRMFDPIRSVLARNPCKKSPYCFQTFDTWFSLSGGRSFIRGNENARGFRIANYEISGGAQAYLSKCWTVGTAVSYERDTLGYRVGGKGKCNTVLGGVYALFRPKKFYAFADLATGYSQNKVKRAINVGSLHFHPRSTAKVYQTSIYGEIGTDFGWNFVLVQPFLGFEWGHYRFDGVHESGGFPLGVNIQRKALSHAFSRLGVHLTSAPLRSGFSMGLDLAWNFRVTPMKNNITVQFQNFGSKFNIQGLPFNRNSYEAIVRFNQLIDKGWEVYAEAACEGWDNATSYSFIGGIKVTW